MNEWLQNLKIGDIVILDNKYGAPDSIMSVRRVTKTHIILKHDMKFRKVDGCLVGAATWEQRCIRESTPQKLNEIYHDNIVRYLQKVAWKDLSLSVLKEVKAMVQPQI